MTAIIRPHDRYLMDLEKPDFRADPAQALAIKKLDNLFDRLLAQQDLSLKDKGLSLVNRLLGRSPSILPERGLYFWGGVGRGKTYLMDMFFDALPIDQKLRIHFHRFMRRVHQELATLADTKNPLEIVADRIAAEAKVICFDDSWWRLPGWI